MAPSKTLGVSSHQGGGHARGHRTELVRRPARGVRALLRSAELSDLQLLVAGWVHCLGRRTITAVALASGGVGAATSRCSTASSAARAWSVDALGRVVFGLALAWIPAGQPLYLVIDDTLARKGGQGDRAWRRCTTTRCCRRPASRSSASATSGWCWRSGCRCRWAAARVRAADPVPAVRRRQARRQRDAPRADHVAARRLRAAEEAHHRRPAPDETGAGPRDGQPGGRLGRRSDRLHGRR